MDEPNGTNKSKSDRKVCSSKCRRIVEYLIVIVCVTGLVVQVTQLVLQYLERRTIVNVEFELLWYNRLPAITICYPSFVSMNKSVERFPQLKPIFDDYKKKMAKVDNNDFDNYALKKELNNIYREKFVNFIMAQNLSIGELSEFGLPFTIPKESSRFDDNEAVLPIVITANGLRLYENQSIAFDRVTDTSPVESVFFSDSSLYRERKCFTFYSQLQKHMRSYQMNTKHIIIEIHHHEDWFPPSIYEETAQNILFAMHSPNTIPQNIDTFMELKTGWFYEIRYDRWKTKLLGPPCQTQCFQYDMYSKTGYKLRSDCINHCITKTIDKMCFKCKDDRNNNQTCDPCFIKSDYLWRIDTIKFDQDINRHLCKNYDPKDKSGSDFCIWDNQEEVSHHCEVICPTECLNRYYNFAIFSKDELTPDITNSSSKWNADTLIQIGHNQLPDQITQHIPEMTFVTFAGNFGGLFGVWMGLSAYAILHYLIKVV